jgi:hypothetical protein
MIRPRVFFAASLLVFALAACGGNVEEAASLLFSGTF